MSEQGRSKVALGTGAALGATVVFAPAAEAATFTVTNLNDSGAGSLRQAVLDSEAAAGPDDIVFQSGLSGTITLTGGQLNVTQALNVQGPGADQLAVSGNNASRIFYLDPGIAGIGTPVSISGLTLRDGQASGAQPDGGAVFAQFASVTIANSVLTNNRAAAGDGGALYSDGSSVTITGSTFSGNTAVYGGGIYVDDDEDQAGTTPTTLTIRDSTFSQNIATVGTGGGMYIDDRIDGDVLIERTTVVGNQARNPAPDPAEPFERGGGILFYGPEPTANVLVQDSTISGNIAEGDGGGIATYFPEAPITIRNTTISGNTAGADGVGSGGGLHSYYDPVINIENSTIAGNTAATAGGGAFRRAIDNAGVQGDNTVALRSTIVADNSAPTGPDLSQGPTPVGTFALGFSLIENPATAVTSETTPGSNILNTDPLLGALAANGGPTQTHLPQPTSAALDAGIANGLTTDQRGFARTADLTATANRTGSDGTDIGAVETRTAACANTPGALAEFNPTDGDDTITGTSGADAISTGPGNDTAKGGGGADCVNGEDGKDKLRGQGGKDEAKGGDGNDNLSGGGGKDKVVGGAGKDTVKGAKGKDKLKGNAGKDKIKAADGTEDKVNCGGGEDKATVDAKDKVAANCEDVTEEG